MSNLIDIQSQIEKLQKQAGEIKAKEFQGTLQDIVSKMKAFGISVKDVQSALASGAGGKRGRKKGAAAAGPVRTVKVAKKAKTPVAAKFRGPNGETWSGRGLTPRWLATLVAQGSSKESFAINA
jgi:DNA-binding protein H-NS